MRPLDNELEALLERAGADSGLAARLAEYGRIVLDANRRFNLTGAKSPAELAEHIADSLTVVPYLLEPYVDVGSGAGMPAIPIAIATGIPVTMIEATAKKALFLESTLERLGLSGTVVAQRAELAGHEAALREAFAGGTCRAVGSAPMVAELLLPLIRPDGVAILQRGAIFPDERRALEDASLMLGGRVTGEERLEGDRRLILVEKRASTALRFPRRPGIPAKRPLCS
ncbi:MAG: 16S rRNA (guanine(527)-N(7))-methyltransferase RsmG [Candidatus Cybelea sp.]